MTTAFCSRRSNRGAASLCRRTSSGRKGAQRSCKNVLQGTFDDKAPLYPLLHLRRPLRRNAGQRNGAGTVRHRAGVVWFAARCFYHGRLLAVVVLLHILRQRQCRGHDCRRWVHGGQFVERFAGAPQLARVVAAKTFGSRGFLPSQSDCAAGCVLCADGSVVGLSDVATCAAPPIALVTVAGSGRRSTCGLPVLNACFSTTVLAAGSRPAPPPRAYWDCAVLLDGGAVSVSWKLRAFEDSATFAVSSFEPSAAVALGFGTRMTFSTAYVGYFDHQHVGHVDSYWISGKAASSVVSTGDALEGVSVSRSQAGLISFNFTRALAPTVPWPDAGAAPPGAPRRGLNPESVQFVYALFPSWRETPLPSDQHTRRSRLYTSVNLTAGGNGTAVEAPFPVPRAVVAHAVLMAIAWGLLFPGAAAASRYVKAFAPGPLAFRLHVGLVAARSLFVLVAFVVVYCHVGRPPLVWRRAHPPRPRAVNPLLFPACARADPPAKRPGGGRRAAAGARQAGR